MWLIFKSVFFHCPLSHFCWNKNKNSFCIRFRRYNPFSKTFWQLTVLVDLPAEVVLAIIGALLDKVVARLGLLLSGDVVVEERVGAERVFVAVAHVALQARSCNQTMLSGFSLGSFLFSSRPFQPKIFTLFDWSYKIHLFMFLIFDFFGPIGLKLQKDIHQEMFMGRQLGNFHATCYGSDFWRLASTDCFAELCNARTISFVACIGLWRMENLVDSNYLKTNPDPAPNNQHIFKNGH